jgi:hypothetical protein
VTDRKARDRADVFFSLLVRNRDRCCVKCGIPGGLNTAGLRVVGLECAHIMPRRFSATRCDLENAVALCPEDHRFYTEHQYAWENFIIERIGLDAWDALRAKAHDLSVRVDWVTEASALRGLTNVAMASA